MNQLSARYLRPDYLVDDVGARFSGFLSVLG